MVKNIFSAMIIAFCVQAAFAQTAQQSTNPKRTVLYTLAPNEVIVANEYAICAALSHKFALITANKQTRKTKLIINGKVIIELDEKDRLHDYWSIEDYLTSEYLNVEYLNICLDKNYVFTYTKEGKMHLNAFGKTYATGDSEYEYYYDRYINSTQTLSRIEESFGNKFWGENTNRKQTHTSTNDTPIELRSPNRIHSFFSDLANEYVIIDGKKIGKSPAIQVYYNEDKNAFVWNSIEKQELVVYEYKLQ